MISNICTELYRILLIVIHRYTNHCLRSTSISILDQSGIEGRQIIRISGHKSEASIKSYSRNLTSHKKREISSTLSKAVGLRVSNDIENVNPGPLMVPQHVFNQSNDVVIATNPLSDNYMLLPSVSTEFAQHNTMEYAMEPYQGNNVQSVPNFCQQDKIVQNENTSSHIQSVPNFSEQDHILQNVNIGTSSHTQSVPNIPQQERILQNVSQQQATFNFSPQNTNNLMKAINISNCVVNFYNCPNPKH